MCYMNAEPGELVFEENWDDFNMDIWEHELTMGGGGNWEFQEKVFTYMIHLYLTFDEK